MAAASLALAACGGGDSTVQAPQTQPTPPDCTAVPRPDGCPVVDPPPPAGLPMPLAGLSPSAQGSAAVAIAKPLEGVPFRFSLTGSELSNLNNRTMHYTSLLQRREDLGGIDDAYEVRFYNTKIPKVVPSENSGGISYMFDMFTRPQNSEKWSFSYAQLQQDIRDQEKIFSLGDNSAFTSVARVQSIATQFGEGWDYSILKANVPNMKDGEKDATLYTELWTDYGNDNEDYMVGGWWLIVPNSLVGDYNYRYGVFARGHKPFTKGVAGGSSAAFSPLTGTATYKGAAAGLHSSSENNIVKVSRLLGKVTINVDFEGTGDRGNLKGRIHDLTLDGNRATGEIIFNTSGDNLGHNIVDSQPASSTTTAGRASYRELLDLGNINGVNYKGRFVGVFTGARSSDNTKQPSGITGVIGGTATDNSGLFTASFGAKKVEE